MSRRFRMCSIQLELELILDLTVSGTAWQGIELKVTVATLTVEMVSIGQSAEAVSRAAGRPTAVVVGRTAAGPLAGSVYGGPILFPCLHPVLQLVLSRCPMCGGPELFPGLHLGPRPKLWHVAGAVAGGPALQRGVFPDPYLELGPACIMICGWRF